jgi:hypothetical protein
LSDVERAFVHVDYEHEHDIYEEHKPLYEKKEKQTKRSLKDIILRRKAEGATESRLQEQATANAN